MSVLSADDEREKPKAKTKKEQRNVAHLLADYRSPKMLINASNSFRFVTTARGAESEESES